MQHRNASRRKLELFPPTSSKEEGRFPLTSSSMGYKELQRRKDEAAQLRATTEKIKISNSRFKLVLTLIPPTSQAKVRIAEKAVALYPQAFFGLHC